MRRSVLALAVPALVLAAVVPAAGSPVGYEEGELAAVVSGPVR